MKNLFFTLIIVILCSSCIETKPDSEVLSKEYKEACEIPDIVMIDHKGHVKSVTRHGISKTKVDNSWVQDETDAANIEKKTYNEGGFLLSSESIISNGNVPEVLKSVYNYEGDKLNQIKTFNNGSLVGTATMVCKGRYEYELLDTGSSSIQSFFLDDKNRLIKNILELVMDDGSKVRNETIITYGNDVDTVANYMNGKLSYSYTEKVLRRDKVGNPIETVVDQGNTAVFYKIIYEYYN